MLLLCMHVCICRTKITEGDDVASSDRPSMLEHFECMLINSTYVLVHKQMYWIRTNLRRFQPSKVFCNIQMLIFHYIMEYFGNLSSPCP